MRMFYIFLKSGWGFGFGALAMKKPARLVGQVFFMPLFVVFMFLLASGMFNEQAFAAAERVVGERGAGEQAPGEQTTDPAVNPADEQAPGEQAAGEQAFIPGIQAGPEFDFRKTRWGMTVDEVKASEGRGPDDEGNSETSAGTPYEYLTYVDIKFLGYQGHIVYIFDQEKLALIDVHFLNFSQKKQLLSRLEKRLGSPVFKNNNSERLISSGWNFGNSKIIFRNYLIKTKYNRSATITFYSAKKLQSWPTEE